MMTAGAGSSVSARDQLGLPGTWTRLVNIAFWSTRNAVTAEDLVVETVTHVLDPKKVAWDGRASFFAYMSFRLRAVFKGWMSRMSAHEVPTDPDEVAEELTDEGPLPDEQVDVRRKRGLVWVLGERLLAELKEEDPLAGRCFELYAAGASIKDQATALGCTEERVQLLQAAIRRRATRIHEEYDAAERDRMDALQAETAAAKADRPSQGAT
jgi:DNA-directed RNA polymerase specialized sigma24 family protein